jgi:hypothetical protein
MTQGAVPSHLLAPGVGAATGMIYRYKAEPPGHGRGGLSCVPSMIDSLEV